MRYAAMRGSDGLQARTPLPQTRSLTERPLSPAQGRAPGEQKWFPLYVQAGQHSRQVSCVMRLLDSRSPDPFHRSSQAPGLHGWIATLLALWARVTS